MLGTSKTLCKTCMHVAYIEQCCQHTGGGPGYASPLEAFRSGPRETLMYVVCVPAREGVLNYVATVDVDPASSAYCKVNMTYDVRNVCTSQGVCVCVCCVCVVCGCVCVCVPAREGVLNYLATVDVDPASATYCKVILMHNARKLPFF